MTDWIGGEWMLQDTPGAPPLSWSTSRFLGAAASRATTGLYSSGRAALRAAVEALGGRGGAVLLPAYSCWALTHAVLEAGARPIYYPGDAFARPRWDALGRLAAVHHAQLAVVVHAFGLLQDGAAVRRLRRDHGLAVIEDCSHTLCNGLEQKHLGPSAAVAAVASLRKLLPTGAAGLCTIWREACLPKPETALGAFAAARAAAFSVPPGTHRHRLLDRCEALLDRSDIGLDSPSGAAEHALATLAAGPRPALDQWRRACRRNHRVLAETLTGYGFTVAQSTLPNGVCPPGLVICHPNRTRLAAHLLNAGIESTLHWSVPQAAKPLLSRAERLWGATALTLPCDARYGARDIRRVADACRAYAGGSLPSTPFTAFNSDA